MDAGYVEALGDRLDAADAPDFRGPSQMQGRQQGGIKLVAAQAGTLSARP